MPVGIGIHCSAREGAARHGDEREMRRGGGNRAGLEAASWEARAAARCDGGKIAILEQQTLTTREFATSSE